MAPLNWEGCFNQQLYFMNHLLRLRISISDSYQPKHEMGNGFIIVLTEMLFSIFFIYDCTASLLWRISGSNISSKIFSHQCASNYHILLKINIEWRNYLWQSVWTSHSCHSLFFSKNLWTTQNSKYNFRRVCFSTPSGNRSTICIGKWNFCDVSVCGSMSNWQKDGFWWSFPKDYAAAAYIR